MKFQSFLILVLLIVLTAFFEEDYLANYQTALHKFSTEYPQEKVFIDFDRDTYAPGETMWYSTYLVIASSHVPSSLSKIVYLSLVNQNKTIVTQKKIRIDSLSAAGEILLPDSLPSGNYTAIAYTTWMTNFSPDFFFKKKITIINPRDEVINPTPKKNTLALDFFPEGGNLVNGLRSKVGYKAIDKSGRGVICSGYIADDLGKRITSFKSNALGMGSFVFIPEKGRKYIGIDSASQLTFELPQPQETGYVMTVTNKLENKEIVVRLQSNTDTNGFVSVLAHVRGQVTYAVKVDHSKKINFIKIPTEKFPTGIVHLTAIDPAGAPRCERLVFVNNDDELTISLNADKSAYKAFEKVTLDIEVKDKNGNPTAAHLSLAAIDQEQLNCSTDDENIVANLFLVSDLKGHIESPGYYFNKSNPSRASDLDALLLTQGWRRFVWLDLLQGKWPTLHGDIEQSISIKGTVRDLYTARKSANARVVLINKSKTNPFFKYVTTDDKGEFEFDDLDFYDSARLTLVGEKKSSNNYIKFDLYNNFSYRDSISVLPWQKPDYQFSTPYDFLKQAAVRISHDSLIQLKNAVLLKEVEVVKPKEEDPRFTQYGKNGKLIKFETENSLGYTHVLQMIQGRVVGLNVTGFGMDYTASFRGVNSLGSQSPAYMLNNMPIDEFMVSTINPSDVAAIRAISTPVTLLGVRGSHGAIYIFTKLGSDYKNEKREAGVLQMSFAGYSCVREFYSPDYSVKQPDHSMPDNRSTLYWNPLIKTNASGKSRVTFYCSDQKTTIRSRVQGLSSTGLAGYGELTLAVD